MAKLNVLEFNLRHDRVYIRIKRFLHEHRRDNVEFDVSEESWKTMVEFQEVFELIKNVTLQLQSKQMALGDFYKSKMMPKHFLRTNNHPVAQKILKMVTMIMIH